jgi:hypothetical protein
LLSSLFICYEGIVWDRKLHKITLPEHHSVFS